MVTGLSTVAGTGPARPGSDTVAARAAAPRRKVFLIMMMPLERRGAGKRSSALGHLRLVGGFAVDAGAFEAGVEVDQVELDVVECPELGLRHFGMLVAVPSGVLGQIGRVGLEVGRVGPQAQARPLRVEI